MMGNSSRVNDAACRRAVRTLIATYDWALPHEDGLVKWVLDAIPARDPPADLDKLAYSVAQYEACRQTEDPVRRERAYGELFRFLFRAAYNRWPELAEDATQRALILVFEQIDRCRSPATFVSFALYKLLQAFTDEQRARRREIPSGLSEPTDTEGNYDPISPEAQVLQEDCLRLLVGTIKNLPDRRQQEVILLKFFGGLSDEDIGARLQLTPGHVRVLRHRGLVQLRKDESLKNCFGV